VGRTLQGFRSWVAARHTTAFKATGERRGFSECGVSSEQAILQLQGVDTYSVWVAFGAPRVIASLRTQWLPMTFGTRVHPNRGGTGIRRHQGKEGCLGEPQLWEGELLPISSPLSPANVGPQQVPLVSREVKPCSLLRGPPHLHVHTYRRKKSRPLAA